MADRIGEAPDDLAPREEWIINTCREFKLPIRSADEDFFEAGGTFANPHADHCQSRGGVRRNARSRGSLGSGDGAGNRRCA